ncbi:MAG: RNA-guided endonuclease InsQ/TnpB family protein [Acidiferrobacteraceae bacterium]
MSKRIISLKLVATPEQSTALADLATIFAQACNAIVPFVQKHRCWNRVALHHLAYYPIREQWSTLGSQMVCQAVHRVADAYQVLKVPKGKPVPATTFYPTSVTFDQRTYSIKGDTVSLFTLGGRVRVPFVCGKHQRNLLVSGAPKEAQLIVRKGVWYFNLVLDLPDISPVSGGSILGVDVGENNLAASSTGKVWGGGPLRHNRDMYLAHRRRLQSNGSRAAKRKLCALSGREQRHVKHVNHEVSKAIVTEAIRSGAGTIRMEDLTHIRARIKAGKRVRTRLHRWAFRQLQDFVAYKAQSVGLTVGYIHPAYTSQTCSACGEIGKRAKHRFSCSCGNRAHSDVNASRNIAWFAEPVGTAKGRHSNPSYIRASRSPRCSGKLRPLGRGIVTMSDCNVSDANPKGQTRRGGQPYRNTKQQWAVPAPRAESGVV